MQETQEMWVQSWSRDGMAAHSGIFSENPRDRGAWRAMGHGVSTELDTAEATGVSTELDTAEATEHMDYFPDMKANIPFCA